MFGRFGSGAALGLGDANLGGLLTLWSGVVGVDDHPWRRSAGPYLNDIC
jgi:hypothetical protein